MNKLASTWTEQVLIQHDFWFWLFKFNFIIMHTCASYIFSFLFATSLRMMVPMYSITMVYFSMSLAAYSPKPWIKIMQKLKLLQVRVIFKQLSQSVCSDFNTSLLLSMYCMVPTAYCNRKILSETLNITCLSCIAYCFT